MRSGEDIQLLVDGASCASCVSKIETALRKVPGVTDATMNLTQRTATVHGDAATQALISVLENIGYQASSL